MQENRIEAVTCLASTFFQVTARKQVVKNETIGPTNR